MSDRYEPTSDFLKLVIAEQAPLSGAEGAQDNLRRLIALTADAEVTLEANPETVSVARLSGYREAGVTRLSFGVQSFHDAEPNQGGHGVTIVNIRR